jgi:hypothetical protein
MMTLDLGSPIFRLSLSQIPRGNWLWRSISTVWQPNPSWSKAIAQMAMDACQHAKPLASGDAEDDPSVSPWGDRPPRDFGGEKAGRVGKQRVSACKTWDIHTQSIEHDWTFFARFCQFNMNSRTWGITCPNIIDLIFFSRKIHVAQLRSWSDDGSIGTQSVDICDVLNLQSLPSGKLT